jgi:hypothetical protein
MFNFFKKKQQITEETKAFKNKGKSGITQKTLENTRGEGFDDVLDIGYGKTAVGNFNSFYRNFINTQFSSKRSKIQNYRVMADMPEISSVIEDICIESTQEDTEGKILNLEVLNKELENNENVMKNIQLEFDELFHKNIRINDNIIEYFRTYFVDAELFIEKVVNKGKPSLGIQRLKRLPTETMDYIVDPDTGRITAFLQYKKTEVKCPASIEEAMSSEDIIVFYPEQISYIDYGIYAGTKKNVIGYLEKAKQPFNQLKLIETSIVIYRIVRSPERLVFNIDTGAMPKDKAIKFVEKIKQKMAQKVEFDSQTGTLRNQPNITSMIENYFLPQSSDGRGSSISSVGGNPSGFSELDDLYYFARKLYIALKYPISRVINAEERRPGDTLFMGSQTGEITIDEIRWAKFLERHQQKFCQMFTDIFILHLEFKGLKKEYDISENDLNVTMTPPNEYKAQMNQALLDTRFNNYNQLSNNSEFSKTFLMREYLKWDDEMIKANAKGFEEDKKYLPQDDGY